jgi:hypothetical protein
MPTIVGLTAMSSSSSLGEYNSLAVPHSTRNDVVVGLYDAALCGRFHRQVFHTRREVADVLTRAVRGSHPEHVQLHPDRNHFPHL